MACDGDVIRGLMGAWADFDFVQQPGRTLANFSGTQRILESAIRIPTDPGGPQRTANFAAVNRKVAGSSPASGACFLNWIASNRSCYKAPFKRPVQQRVQQPACAGGHFEPMILLDSYSGQPCSMANTILACGA
jgi:hypothetical protein